MVYLLLGPDYESRDAKISEIKNKFLPSYESHQFDCETLYAHKLEPEQLKKTLIALPVIAKQRVVILKEFHKLSDQNKEMVLELAPGLNHCTLILDSDKIEQKDEFVRELSRFAKTGIFGKEDKPDVFAMARAISTRKQTDALRILSQLLSQGDKPLKIMGGLVWYWKNERRNLPFEKFKKGLEALQEADLNIKRSRLKEEHALELLVIKLCFEEAG